MAPRVLARVYIANGRNIRLPTTPGRSIQFHGGCAQIVDGRDMPFVFQLPEAHVQPEPEAMPWAPEWLAGTRQIVAKVTWPDEWRVTHRNQDEWNVEGPETVMGASLYSGVASVVEGAAFPEKVPVDEPGPAPEVATRPWYPGPVRAEDLLQDPPDETEPPPPPKQERTPRRSRKKASSTRRTRKSA